MSNKKEIWLSGWPSKSSLRKAFLYKMKLEEVIKVSELIDFKYDESKSEKQIRVDILMAYIDALQTGKIMI